METDVASEIEAENNAVVEHLMTGKSIDPEIARRIEERARRITEETYRKHGLLDIAVPAIRELRDE